MFYCCHSTNNSHDQTGLRKGVTLEAGETIKVGNTTLRIDFLTKSNGEKVAQIKEVFQPRAPEVTSVKKVDSQSQATDSKKQMGQQDVPTSAVTSTSSKVKLVPNNKK